MHRPSDMEALRLPHNHKGQCFVARSQSGVTTCKGINPSEPQWPGEHHSVLVRM